MKRADPAPLQLQLFPGAEPPPAVEPDPPAPPERQAKASIDELAQILNDGAELRGRLGRAMPGRLGALTLTDNHSTMISARTGAGGRLDVRIQRCFDSAPEATLAAVATFLTSDKRSLARRRALAEVRDYFALHGPRPAARRRRRVVLRPVGQTLDLRQVCDELNDEYFDGALDVRVTWGRALPRRRRRRQGRFSVRLGTYGDQDRVVRIHRCLDRADVPRYVVEAVIYHEMLHAAMPPVVENGRRRIHTPEFRRRERLFPHYQRAERWLDRNLKRLI